MFTLDDDTGDITIDFTIEHEGAEPETLKVVVSPPPTFGAYKRIRAEVAKINKDRDELSKQLREDDSVGVAEMNSRLNEQAEDGLLGWWRLVMIGDDSYKGRATPAPPDDLDTWPVYLVSNDSLAEALSHWKTVPLARGSKPGPPTS
jgi:hypothetical protein